MSRRLFAVLAIILAAGGAMVRASCAATPKLQTVLWIGGFAHDFDAVAKILVPALERRIPIDIRVVRDGSFLDDPDVERLDAILMYHCFQSVDGVLTPDQQKRLLTLVRGGVGVVAIHASYYSFVKWDAVRELYGARFIKHGSSKAVLKVRCVDPKHPIMKGLGGTFTVVSELYQSTPLASDCHVLARAKQQGTSREYPSVWTRRYGKGRVVTILPGHWPDSFRVVPFQRLLAASTLWAAGKKGLEKKRKR